MLRVMSREDAIAEGGALASLLPQDLTESQPGSNWHHSFMDPDTTRAKTIARHLARRITPLLQNEILDGRCAITALAVKPAGAAGTPLHQHYPSSAAPFARRIAAWLSLSDASPEARTFRLAPYTQRLAPYIRTHGSGDFFDGYTDRIEAEYCTDILVEPGEAVFFEDSILHATGPNDASTPNPSHRVNAIATFLGKDMPSARWRSVGEGEGRFEVEEFAGCREFGEFAQQDDPIPSKRRTYEVNFRNHALDFETFARCIARRKADDLRNRQIRAGGGLR